MKNRSSYVFTQTTRRRCLGAVDPQVVSDQINATIPGGSLEIASPEMISGGSVGTGATVLGSLASASADDEEVEAPVA